MLCHIPADYHKDMMTFTRIVLTKPYRCNECVFLSFAGVNVNCNMSWPHVIATASCILRKELQSLNNLSPLLLTFVSFLMQCLQA